MRMNQEGEFWMKCSHCGKENQEQFAYCVYCGTELEKVNALSDQPDDHQQSAQEYAEPKKKHSKRNKILLPIFLVFGISALLIVTWIFVISPWVQYRSGIEKMEQAEYDRAFQIFSDLGEYKDSRDKREQCEVEICRNAVIGDEIPFGSYEQDNNLDNGSETIFWKVLSVEEDRILVVSCHALERSAYHESYMEVTWASCMLRSWLNQVFLKTAFTETEREHIMVSTLPDTGTDDQIFLLSLDEAATLLGEGARVQAEASDFAIAQGVPVNEDHYCWWWLRTAGRSNYYAVNVVSEGGINQDGDGVDDTRNGVRPAMWIMVP